MFQRRIPVYLKMQRKTKQYWSNFNLGLESFIGVKSA